MSARTVAGPRVAFEKTLVTELIASDLKIRLKCMQRKACEASKYSPKGLKTISGLSKFGEEAGGRVGTSAAVAINPRLIEIAKPDNNYRFKNLNRLTKCYRQACGRISRAWLVLSDRCFG